MAFIAGGVLLGAAVVVLMAERETARAAWHALRSPAPLPVVLLIGSLIGNLLLTSAVFSVLVRPFARVHPGEMLALLASSGLLNLAPLRPGLIGRLAWHRTMNAMPLRDGVRTVIEASVLSVIVAACWAGAAWLLAGWSARYAWLVLIVSLPALLGAAAVTVALCAPGRERLCVAGALRSVEVLLIAVRYHAVFALIGHPIPVDAAVGLACVATIAAMVPVAGSGLGVREWAIGLSAPLLVPMPDTAGLAADLVHRAAELFFIVITGSAATVWLSRRLVQFQRSTRGAQAPREAE